MENFVKSGTVLNELYGQPTTCPYSAAASGSSSRCGYSTEQGRRDWLIFAYGELSAESSHEISNSFEADRDVTTPLYYWQLHSLLGDEPIVDIVRKFYELIFADEEHKLFRSIFIQTGTLDHHVTNTSSFWIDVMGGGARYDGGDYKLNFLHTANAEAFMTARGAKRWMFHMTKTLLYFKDRLNSIDMRVYPCIVEFIRVKMKKYARDHEWEFDASDFDGLTDSDSQGGV